MTHCCFSLCVQTFDWYCMYCMSFYLDTLSFSNPFALSLSLPWQTEGVRVTVNILSEGAESSPILFVVRQKQAVLSFQVPLILRGLYQRKYPYAHVGRTLCQPPTRSLTETQYFFVDVSTLSSLGTHYQLRISRVDSFTLHTDKKFSFTASPSQPQYFKYVFPDGVDTVIVKVNSEMTFPCSVMSIQDIQCPVYDLDNNVAFIGMYQTMTKTAAITVQRKDFPSNSFYVVVVVKTEDEACGGPLRFYPLRPDELIDAGNRSKILDVVVSPAISCESLSQAVNRYDCRIHTWWVASVLLTCSCLLQVVNVTGNQDICYYNFLCAHPLGNLSAFNNILSNLGYVMLGLLFLLIVLQRDIIHSRALDRNDLNALECGIPKHFGLFYAMGTALMMEGLLSACYHVCPNYTNFQFDTSFMYMIAGLCVLKLYQKRHPDINASAYTAYACLAAVIFFSVLGVVFGKGNMVFWIVFSVLHILATMLLSTQLYYMGRWRLDSGILRRIVYVIYTDCIRQCSGPIQLITDMHCVVVFCLSRAAYGLLKTPNDFASYLLAIAICNLLLYFAFYIIMKLRSGERIQCMAMVCILFTAVVWGFALFFFFQGLSTWQKTPAESREHNRDCIVLSFFDDHDIWHFLSSIAMFGSFLVLLTMDDDLDNVQRDKIFVF
uniref:SID1 transmembrane family member 2 n=1 Tax=Salmo trutta TaxID=8032 RepID=A0A674CE28_SALTR